MIGGLIKFILAIIVLIATFVGLTFFHVAGGIALIISLCGAGLVVGSK